MNTKMVSEQLKALSEAVLKMNVDELSLAMLDTCLFFMSEAEKAGENFSDMDESGRKELISAYSAVSGFVANFSNKAESDCNTKLREQSSALEAQLRKVQEEFSRIDDIRSETEKEKERGIRLSHELNSLKDDLHSQIKLCETLTCEISAYNPDAVEEKRKENEKLLIELADLRRENSNLAKEKEAYDNEILDWENKNSELKALISQMPEESRTLLEEHDALNATLSRLKKTETECSREKQKELEVQIRALAPRAEKLSQEMEVLEEHKSNLEKATSEYDRKKNEVATNLFDLFDERFSELAAILSEHKSSLTKTKEMADKLKTALDDCKKLRDEYREWFEADKNIMQAMMAALDSSEHNTLCETLDINKTNSVSSLCKQISDALNEFDGILSKCTQAADNDQKIIRERVGKN